MPNWCVGVLKVRGKKDNLINFVLEGLQPVNLDGEDLEALVLTNECIETNATCWIKGTTRGFIDNLFIETGRTERLWLIIVKRKICMGSQRCRITKPLSEI